MDHIYFIACTRKVPGSFCGVSGDLCGVYEVSFVFLDFLDLCCEITL